MKILDRHDQKWKEASGFNGLSFCLKNDSDAVFGESCINEWSVLSVYPTDEIPEKCFLHRYPNAFNTMLTECAVQNTEWEFNGESIRGCLQGKTYRSRKLPDLLVRFCNGFLSEFTTGDVGSFFYSADYDMIVLYKNERYTMNDRSRMEMAQSYLDVIRKLYGKEDANANS